MASSIVVYCGHAVVTFDDLVDAWLSSNNFDIVGSFGTAGRRAVIPLALTRLALSSGIRLGLLSILLTHRLAQTTNPRDKIFAFCGIAADAGPDILDIRIDYHLPSIDVQRNVAVAMMTKERTLDIMSTPKDVESLEFPSWVPDFGLPVITAAFLR